MITTGCQGCCFFREDDCGKGCTLRQFCISTMDGKVVAPGYCRKCRSNIWAKKQGTSDTELLHKKVTEENKLAFELLVMFDESQNSIHDLRQTLDSSWYHEYATRVIIVDTTGFGDRKNIALQYLNDHKHKLPTIVDSSVEHELLTHRSETVKRLAKQIKSKVFMVIPCGFMLHNVDWLAASVQQANSRVIKWSFPSVVGSTVLFPKDSYNGLYITRPYRALLRAAKHISFLEQLEKEEEKLDMGLVMSCTECGLI